MEKSEGIKIIALNKKASHNYELMDKFEAGMVLTGTEVKSLRNGKANLTDAYAKIQNGEAYIVNMHIAPYEMGNRYNHEPLRRRKLLLHKLEIKKLTGKTVERGLSLIPTKCYFKNGRAKIELALGRGKKTHDKRQDIKKHDMERDARRDHKSRIKIK